MLMRRRAGLTCADHKPTHGNHEEETGCAQAGFVKHKKEGWADPHRSQGVSGLIHIDHKEERN